MIIPTYFCRFIVSPLLPTLCSFVHNKLPQRIVWSIDPSIHPSVHLIALRKRIALPVHFCLCLSATLCLKSLCYSVKTFLFPHSHDPSSSGNLGARLLRFGSYCTISRTVLSFPSLRPSPPSPRVRLGISSRKDYI